MSKKITKIDVTPKTRPTTRPNERKPGNKSLPKYENPPPPPPKKK